MNIDIRWLEDFLTLADMRHFSKAAQARHITQPAFGRRIKSLEQAIGHPLVDRTTTPVSLTPAGKQFRTTARSIVEQMKLGMQNLHHLDQQLNNPIRVATPHSLASPTLTDLIGPLDVPFSVDILRVDLGIEALKEGECDYLLCFEQHELMQPPFQSVILGNGRFLLVSPPDNSGQPLFSPAMPELPFLRYSPGCNTARLIEQHQPQVPAMLNPVFESSMCQIHKEMALRGKGVAWLPDNLIRNELDSGELIALLPDELSIPFQIRLYRTLASLSPEAEALWEELKVNAKTASVS